jgi:hypothetical protein
MPAGKPNRSHLSPEYRAYISSPAWRAKAAAAKARAGHRCQLCNRTGSLDAHHRTYERFGGDELPEDLTVLCRKCHEKHHKPKRTRSQNKEAIQRDRVAMFVAMEWGRTYSTAQLAAQQGLTVQRAGTVLSSLRQSGLVMRSGKRWRKREAPPRSLTQANPSRVKPHPVIEELQVDAA